MTHESAAMYRAPAAVVLLAVLLAPAQILAATTPAFKDGELLSREPCPASSGNYADYRARQLATFEQEADAARAQGLAIRSTADAAAALISEREYVERRGGEGVICERLTYGSDGLRVVAYLFRPVATTPGKRHPLLIFNRGGALEDSKLRPNTQFGFDRFVREGYVVLGSQYRGNDGGEGREEIGGADLRDVAALLTLGRTLPNVDTANVYALGYSRGGMMTLLALRAGLAFNAVAVVGAPTDLASFARAGDARRLEPFRALVPNFDADPDMALRNRSALYWPEAVSAPLLMLQGGADPLVSATVHTLPFAARMQELKRPFELVLYDGDTHGLMINGKDRDERILAWFARFRKTPAPASPDTRP